MGRRRVSRVALAVALLLAVVATPVRYLATVVEDGDVFVALADDVADDPVVRREVARVVTALTFESLEADLAVADLLPDGARAAAVPATRIASELVTEAAFTLLHTDLARRLAEPALRDLHGQVTGDGDEVVVDLRASIVRTSRELGGPAVGTGAAKLVAGADGGRYVLVDSSSDAFAFLEVVRATPDVATALGLAALAALVVGVAASPDRRRALTQAGIVVMAAAMVGLLVVSFALHVLLGSTGVGSTVARVVTADLAAHQEGVILAGAALALAGLLLGDRPAAVALRQLPGRVWRRDGVADAVAVVIGDNPPFARLATWSAGALAMLSWPSPTARIVITIAVVTLAAQAAIWLFTAPGARADRARARLSITSAVDVEHPDRTVRLRVTLAVLTLGAGALWPAWSVRGAANLFAVGALLQAAADLWEARAAFHRSAADAPALVGIEPAEPSATGPTPARWLAVAALTVLGGIVVGTVITVGSTTEAQAADGCNGHVELCDRRIDEVVFAGSHNAMAATDLGWDLAMQTHDIITQLDGGIRSLLIDTHYWDRTGSVEGGDDAAARLVIEAALSDDVPRPGTWLCHGFCALGASDLTGELAAIRLWLDAHPTEVLLLIIQDEISTEDTFEAFEASGLDELVHTHEPGTPFPTLGELVDADERVIVYAENEGTPDSWYQNAWDTAFVDTPYSFGVRSDFNCDVNRGDVDNPLFLVNHWITTGIPVREAFEVVNRRDVLLERVEECRDELGREPTVLAVDFVETGDLIEVVDELNGVSGSDG